MNGICVTTNDFLFSCHTFFPFSASVRFTDIDTDSDQIYRFRDTKDLHFTKSLVLE